jgi:hypothetical protein
LSTRSFQALLAGKTGQWRAAGSRSACAEEPANSAATEAAAIAAATVSRFMGLCIGR